jgi:hypothetical protein
VVLEAKAVLTKVYGVDALATTQQLTRVASGPGAILPVDGARVTAAMATADALRVDLTDALLIETVSATGAGCLVTDDSRLADACRTHGITPEQPLDGALRQEIAAWEAAHLPAKGLARVLTRTEQWLALSDAV